VSGEFVALQWIEGVRAMLTRGGFQVGFSVVFRKLLFVPIRGRSNLTEGKARRPD
jgi:hypothetical protein